MVGSGTGGSNMVIHKHNNQNQSSRIVSETATAILYSITIIVIINDSILALTHQSTCLEIHLEDHVFIFS